MQNSKLPMLIIAGGIGLALIFAFTGAKAQNPNNNTGIKTNPDPHNHPNAVLINGVWRDGTHFYNPNTRVWMKMADDKQEGIGASLSFNSIMPQCDIPYFERVTNYMSIILITKDSNFQQINIGDKLKLTHPDYSNKIGSVTHKYNGAGNENYIIVNIP